MSTEHVYVSLYLLRHIALKGPSGLQRELSDALRQQQFKETVCIERRV